mgnify:CR=1 FL=1
MRVPKIVEVSTYAQELTAQDMARQYRRPQLINAEDMPAEVKDMILDAYGDDLSPAQRAICKERIAARNARKAEVRPVASLDRPPRDTAKPRAGRGPKKRRSTP